GLEHAALEEGKELLDVFKANNMRDEYSQLFDELSAIHPEDEKLVEISGEERTSIEIDFHPEEVAEELEGLKSVHPGEAPPPDSVPREDFMVLSEEQSVVDATADISPNELSKSLSTYLSELDFYINDRYFGDAESLVENLKNKYPGNQELQARMQRLEQVKRSEAQANATISPASPPQPPVGGDRHEHTEPIVEMGGQELIIESGSDYKSSLYETDASQSGAEMYPNEAPGPIELNLAQEQSHSGDVAAPSRERSGSQSGINLGPGGPLEIDLGDASDSQSGMDIGAPPPSPLEISLEDTSASQSGIDFGSAPGGPVEINLEDTSTSKSGIDYDSTPGSPMEINLEDSSASQSGIDFDSTPGGPVEINLADSSASQSG
ncbi:MAG: hypothetical protein GY765_03825, partial [bacterium]|nr:hypothetical protein [bacterium]